MLTMADLNRRDFLKIGSLALGGSFLASTVLLRTKDESGQPSLERITIPIKRLHPALEGFTIAQLTDFHLYPYTQPDLIRQAVEITNSIKPDLIVLTGDYVWRNVEAIFVLAPILSNLNATQGVYTVIGNHDIWTNVNVVKKGLREARLPILENQGVAITNGKGSLYLAGLDDGWSGEADLDAALENAPLETPVVLLVHEPDLADVYSLDGRVALQLSGHSHGGQVRIPGFGALVLPYLGKKYDLGLYKVNDMWLYTNRGIGNISVPFRYNCPPEITEFTLTRL
jgi:predicted MPP superfamily phosphohydrolase